MGRKFLNRKFESDNSEWDHITEISPKVDVNDALDVQDRSIFFNDELAEPQTNWEKTKEEVRGAMDKAGNVGQYIKYVNAHIEKQNSAINTMKKKKDAWDEEMNLLKHGTSTRENNVNHAAPIFNKQRMIELKDSLIQETNNKINHLNKLKEDVWKMEQDIEQKQKQINQLDNDIKNHSEVIDEKTQKIRDEVKELTKKYDAATIAEIIKNLDKL